MSLERFGIRWNGSHEPMATPMDDGYWTPWHIAEAEIAALRERCGRLVDAVEAWRAYNDIMETLAGVSEINRMLCDADFSRLLGHVIEAMQQVKDHNDLAPAAKEKTDGQCNQV